MDIKSIPKTTTPVQDGNSPKNRQERKNEKKSKGDVLDLTQSGATEEQTQTLEQELAAPYDTDKWVKLADNTPSQTEPSRATQLNSAKRAYGKSWAKK